MFQPVEQDPEAPPGREECLMKVVRDLCHLLGIVQRALLANESARLGVDTLKSFYLLSLFHCGGCLGVSPA